ncbi:diaminopimelate decarboxylase [Candidatus Koribacter versatilis Ellin345]|uniref:Diaminopimelate decarboxylase n=1 Tax=Koribacter versatilis (strain Ellin345) TaxID=204669 RepID=Q1IL09_KORVE|nr:diaminopimelate decarboxylase [Candidatus Koribacter versatilis]ABF42441.1 diaminopimelate decarboxylase [Candidatus Koribacter versatilis Ellin345]
MKPSLPSRPPGFVYKSNKLHVEKIAASDLARRFGTPLYTYSATTIRERFDIFNRAFGKVPHTICYSVKANSNLTILKMLVKLGSGFDVVSGGELERVLVVDKKAAKKVVFSGVGKTAPEMDLAIKSDILLFNIESESELELLASRASKLRKKPRIAFRVNPDVPAETHPYISTGLREHKFGVPITDAALLYAQAASTEWLEPAGVSVHIGSQITDVAPFNATMERVADLVRGLRAQGHNIRLIDGGGGLGIAYRDGDTSLKAFEASAKNYSAALLPPLNSLGIHLLLEPGRAIIGPAGALLTRVVYSKKNGRKTFVIVDAGMNDLIRPALYGAYHEIVAAEPRGTGAETVDVVGPVCETGDFFARDRELTHLEEGDLVAILDAGAYGMSQTSNYNTRPRPAEVLVEGSRAKVVRRRETIKDLLGPER